jgi:hypothetical protein
VIPVFNQVTISTGTRQGGPQPPPAGSFPTGRFGSRV